MKCGSETVATVEVFASPGRRGSSESFGKGGTVRAREAVSVGMADSIGTLEGVIGRFTSDKNPYKQANSVEINRLRMQLG